MSGLAKTIVICDNERAEMVARQQAIAEKGFDLFVRAAQQSDTAGIVKQARAFFDACPLASRVSVEDDGFRAFVEQAATSDTAKIWVVDKAGEVVGIAGAVAFPLYFAPSVTIVQELFWWMDPAERGAAASKQMLAEIEAWAKQIGASQLFMIALENEDADKMAHIYSRCGFAPIERTFTKGL